LLDPRLARGGEAALIDGAAALFGGDLLRDIDDLVWYTYQGQAAPPSRCDGPSSGGRAASQSGHLWDLYLREKWHHWVQEGSYRV